MRTFGVLVLGAVFAVVPLAGRVGLVDSREPQRPSTAQGQAEIEALARRAADEVAASASGWLGNMHPAGQQAFRKWVLAVRAWKREKGAAPQALVAEGVLFDCLGRTLGLKTGFTSGTAVDPRFNDLGLPYRLERAAKFFEAALEEDSSLLEARFRAARIRAPDDATAAQELEEIATSQIDAEVSYLAAVSRAVIAHTGRDYPNAIRWYGQALKLHGRSTAAAVGLSVLTPDRALQFEALDPDDPYYNYPCRVLTPSVAVELGRRIQDVSLQ